VESNDPISSHLRIPVTLTVPPPCVAVHEADFRWEPPTPRVGETISFMGMAKGTAPITFTWDWGEGDAEVGPLVTHTHRHAGNHNVVMTAMNCGTVTDTAAHAVRVTDSHLYLPMILQRP
jgi:PKD repeat protein